MRLNNLRHMNGMIKLLQLRWSISFVKGITEKLQDTNYCQWPYRNMDTTWIHTITNPQRGYFGIVANYCNIQDDVEVRSLWFIRINASRRQQKTRNITLWIFMAWLYLLINVIFCRLYPIKIKTKPTVSSQTSSPAHGGAFSIDKSSLKGWMGQRNPAPS